MDQGRLREFVVKRLEGNFKFSAEVEKAVRTEFFKGRKTLPVAEYGR